MNPRFFHDFIGVLLIRDENRLPCLAFFQSRYIITKFLFSLLALDSGVNIQF